MKKNRIWLTNREKKIEKSAKKAGNNTRFSWAIWIFFQKKRPISYSKFEFCKKGAVRDGTLGQKKKEIVGNLKKVDNLSTIW